MPPATPIPVHSRLVPFAEVRAWPEWSSDWAHLAKDHRYYEVVADTLGFDCRALVLWGKGETVLAIQPCFFVEQDLVIAAPPRARRFAATIRRVFPSFLRLKLLMAGCAAGEGHIGRALRDHPERLAIAHEALEQAARDGGARMVVWKDFVVEDRPHFRHLSRGLKAPPSSVASMPATRLPLHFRSFEDYLTRRLSHASRKDLRRKFRALENAAPLTCTVTRDLGSDLDAALALYEQVRARSPLQFERLTAEFLRQLTARLPDRVRFFLWHQQGRLVAFSLCLVHDGVLYDEYLGLDYRVALDLHLYFVTFRDILSWAIAEGLTAYHSTPLNYLPKRQLGFELAPLDLHIALPWPPLQRLARPFLRHTSPTGAEPGLAEFSNATMLAPPA